MLTDSGRYLVTERDEDLGAFKTPTLREVARTAPYMHDGSVTTLEEVIEFYDRGGRPNPYLDGRYTRCGSRRRKRAHSWPFWSRSADKSKKGCLRDRPTQRLT